MGRGIFYSHDYFMLFKEEDFFYFPSLLDKNGEELDEPDMENGEWDESQFDDFKSTVATSLKADLLDKTIYVDREAYFFAESDKFSIGIDHSGGCPCLFVEAKEYDLWNSPYTSKAYKIGKEVQIGFNKLIKYYGKQSFSTPTSGYTSELLSKYVA